ncbi:hypothetical protein D3C84_1068770 [compost metagenome]
MKVLDLMQMLQRIVHPPLFLKVQATDRRKFARPLEAIGQFTPDTIQFFPPLTFDQKTQCFL